MNLRCQNCGKADLERREVVIHAPVGDPTLTEFRSYEYICPKCHDGYDCGVADNPADVLAYLRDIRARKLWELVVAWGPAFVAPYEFGQVMDAERLLGTAECMLDALYGPEPGEGE